MTTAVHGRDPFSSEPYQRISVSQAQSRVWDYFQNQDTAVKAAIVFGGIVVCYNVMSSFFSGASSFVGALVGSMAGSLLGSYIATRAAVSQALPANPSPLKS